MDDTGLGIDPSLLDAAHMVGRDLYPPYEKGRTVQKYIGSRATHTLSQSYSGSAVEYAIRLVDLRAHRHSGNQKVLPNIGIFYLQGFHQCILPYVIAHLKDFRFVVAHFTIFDKIKHSTRTSLLLNPVLPLEEKEITYTSRNTYTVINDLGPKTSHIWIVFHGMGYLSRYFLKYFDGLDPDEHYLIAPQAPSKYYLNGQFKHVGASWLTRDHTQMGMENILSYLDALMADLSLPTHPKLVIFGYSQGVSISLRWVVRRKIKCDHMILYAGGIPEELQPGDVTHLLDRTQIRIVVGNRDEYITPDRWEQQKKMIRHLFGENPRIEIFEGKHEVRKEIINRLL